MLKVLLLSLSRQYTVDGQYIPSLFIEPEVRHDKTSYCVNMVSVMSVSRYHPCYESTEIHDVHPWSDSTEFSGIGRGRSDC